MSTATPALRAALEDIHPAELERIRVLGLFHDILNLDVLHSMTGWPPAHIQSLAEELVRHGLASPLPFHCLRLAEGLAPALRDGLAPAELASLQENWTATMLGYVSFLTRQHDQNPEAAAQLAQLDQANLLALLDLLAAGSAAEPVMELGTLLFGLFQTAGHEAALSHIEQVCEAALARFKQGWTHAGFVARHQQIEAALAQQQVDAAFAEAQSLFQHTRWVGPDLYPGADLDAAMAGIVLGRALRAAGEENQALELLGQTRASLKEIVRTLPGTEASAALADCLSQEAAALTALARPDQAAALYREALALRQSLGAGRPLAEEQTRLGTLLMLQDNYPDALAHFRQALNTLVDLNEGRLIAPLLHKIGLTHQKNGEAEPAEAAYRDALSLHQEHGDLAAQADTHNQLGGLYDGLPGRGLDAIGSYRAAADLCGQLGDLENEGRVRSNLADSLHQRQLLDEARSEIRRAIECKRSLGDAAAPWTSWAILAAIETSAGVSEAAWEARQQAISGYFTYRRTGGENTALDGQLARVVGDGLKDGHQDETRKALAGLAARPGFPEASRPFLSALQAIADGSRARSLADDPALAYTSAVELALLLDRLG